LQERITSGGSVLDIGCGSGILSIISLLLGARQVVACDIDTSAVEVTKKNAALNPVDPAKLNVYAGDILTCDKLFNKISRQKYDIITANIVADVIIGLVPLMPDLLNPGGMFIASGIISERLESVQSALASHNLSIIENKSSKGWCLVVANG